MADPALAGGSALALSHTGEVREATIAADGTFALAVPGEATYAIHFVEGERFVAVLYFQRNRWSQLRTNRLRLPAPGATGDSGLMAAEIDAGTDDGDDEIDLGEIEIEDGQANPTNNPEEDLDSDGDGIPNIDDDDDDGDGIPDEEDADEDTDIDDSDLGFLVTEVDPEPGDDGVDSDEEIEIELSQPTDPATITAIRLTDIGGVEIPTTRIIEDDDEIELLPEVALVPGTEYRITIGVELTSAAGEPLGAAFSSTFRVEHDDDDDGDDDDDDDGDDDGDDDDGDED